MYLTKLLIRDFGKFHNDPPSVCIIVDQPFPVEKKSPEKSFPGTVISSE